MNAFVEALVTIALAIIGLAIIATLVSPKASTTGVIQAAASGFGNALGVAESPVSGTSLPLSLAYPSTNSYGFGSAQG